MRWLVELGLRAGPALLVPLLASLVALSAASLRASKRARLRGRMASALRSLGEPTPEPFAEPDRVVTLDATWARDPTAEGRAWLSVDDQRVLLEGARRLLVATVEPWHPAGRRSLARGARVRARGLLRRVDDAWTLTPDGDAITLAALDPSQVRDAPSGPWALATLGLSTLLLVAVVMGGRYALAHVDPSPQPMAMTPHGLRWEARWTARQRTLLLLARLSPLHHRAAQRLIVAGRTHELPIPWLDVREMHRVRGAIHARGDCSFEVDFLRRTAQEPPSDDRCGLRARIDAHPLVRAVREESERTATVPDGSFACMDRRAATLRSSLADPTFPMLLREAATCVRDAAAVCASTGCPDAVTVDLARLVIEHRIALRATTHGATIRPAWWRRPSLLRATLRGLASVATSLAVDTLDARFARGHDWPQGFTWASVAEVMRAAPSTSRSYRPIVAHFPGVGVEPSELSNPWSSPELRAPSSNARLAALVEWWRLGEYAPARDAPARERSALVARAVAAASGRRLGAVIEALGDPTVDSVEALALVAYRLTSERELADAWLRAAPVFLPPEASDRAARCRLRTALRQAAQRLRRTELLEEIPWAGSSARACAFGSDVPVDATP
ncbi:MAG: hypothetical protein IPF99_20330 [Deltaproteobacteria bacterium]|nr:hypothetical protein [Deltaproteobacteria bacterium]